MTGTRGRVREHPEWLLTHNTAERALRHEVIACRLSQGTQTPPGTRAFGLLARYSSSRGASCVQLDDITVAKGMITSYLLAFGLISAPESRMFQRTRDVPMHEHRQGAYRLPVAHREGPA
jgi:hypothetical protein